MQELPIKDDEERAKKVPLVYVKKTIPDENGKSNDERLDLTPDGYKWYDCM